VGGSAPSREARREGLLLRLRCGSVEGWGLAAVDSAGGPALSGTCMPTFDGVLSNMTMIGGSSGSAGGSGAIHQIAPPIRTCSRIASARAAGGICCNRGGARLMS
jgi:hypothetical protein